MVKRNLSKLFSIYFILYIFIFIFPYEIVNNYSVKYQKYSGKGIITIDEQNDTIFIYYDVALYWGLFTIKDKAIILRKNLLPVYLATDIKAIKTHHLGLTEFFDSISIYHSGDDSTIVQGRFPVNDWVILPIYLRYIDTDTFNTTLLQGDFSLIKSMNKDTVVWQTSDSVMTIKLLDSIPVFFDLKGNTFTRINKND